MDASAALLEALRQISTDKIKLALERALEATSTLRDGKVEDDIGKQIEAAKLVISYVVGRPREAEPEEIKQAESMEEVIERAKSSPSYRAAMIGAYENGLARLRALE